MGFQQSTHKAVVHRQGSSRSTLLVCVYIYINDLIITGAKEAEVEAFKAQMKATF